MFFGIHQCHTFTKNNNELKRRNFLELSASTTAAFMLSLDAFSSSHKTNITVNNNFKLKILATNWGFNGSLDEYLSKVKNDGYDGIEILWPAAQKDQEEMFALLKQKQLEAGFLCRGDASDYQENFDVFKSVTEAAATNKYQKPLYINCHSGKDYFSMEQNGSFINFTTALTKKTGVRIYHETHRSRMLFAAPVAKSYIQKHSDLRITFDVSHWCNVSESLLADQQETINLTLPRVDHVHARIGHPEGPQVNDPRAPEWKDAVAAHFAWWDKIVEMKKQQGDILTVLTEFGPPDYMPTEPYTRKPLSNQWAVNVYMMKTLRERYSS